MPYRNIQHFISQLEEAGELIRIKEYVNPHLELSEITDRISKSSNNKALLFENTGYDFPVLINAMGSYKRMCLALGVNSLDDIGKEIDILFNDLTSPKKGFFNKIKMLPQLNKIASWMPKSIKGRGACQEIVMKEADITKLPVLTCWSHDGGPFITLPIVHTTEPSTGTRNVGLYRMQVFGKQLTAMHWHKHKDSASHYHEYKRKGMKMPVAIALGGDPVYTYAASAPLPPAVDEYILAGFLRKKRVELVKCLTQDIEVPADADIIIEGYIDPNEELLFEGPFGDHTGFYSLADYYPAFHITCITHQKNAVYPTTIVGIPPQEDAYIGKATERIFLPALQKTLLAELIDMNMPVEGVFHNIVTVSIKKEYEGHAQKVMNALWGAGQMMFNKILVVAAHPTPVDDYIKLGQLFTQHVDPANDIYFSKGPMDVLDHSASKFAFGSKMCIDLTNTSNNIHQLSIKQLDKDSIKKQLPEIVNINDSLLQNDIAIVFVTIKKDRKNHVKELNELLFNQEAFKQIKMIVYLDGMIDASSPSDMIWIAANNIDPIRDCYTVAATNKTSASHIGLDGTRKTKQLDGFERDWPNVLSADDETIKTIDAKWASLNLGDFIPSPSLKYRNYLYQGKAVAEE